MKHFIILLIVTLLTSPQEENNILKGKYKIEITKGFQFPNSTIIVNDTLYNRTFSDGRKSSGTVKYWEYFVILKDDNSSQIMEFKRKEIKQDTISFGLKETDPKKSETISYLHINIALGKLIKIE